MPGDSKVEINVAQDTMDFELSVEKCINLIRKYEATTKGSSWNILDGLGHRREAHQKAANSRLIINNPIDYVYLTTPVDLPIKGTSVESQKQTTISAEAYEAPAISPRSH